MRFVIPFGIADAEVVADIPEATVRDIVAGLF